MNFNKNEKSDGTSNSWSISSFPSENDILFEIRYISFHRFISYHTILNISISSRFFHDIYPVLIEDKFIKN